MKHQCTLRRAKIVMDEYKSLINSLGILSHAVSKTYIYEQLSKKLYLSARTIQQIVNHYEEYEKFSKMLKDSSD